MAGINKAIIVGRVGKDPDTRYTQSGSAVTSFSVATSETWNDKQSGEKRESTEWHRIVCWNKLAEICGKYVQKGSQVYVEGKLQTRSWEQDGVTRYTTEILASTVQFLGSRNQSQGSSVNSPPDPPEPIAGGEDVPF